MRKFYPFLVILLSIPLVSTAQPEPLVDCCKALEIFNADPIQFPNVWGTGNEADPVEDCSCSGGEVNSYWFRFDCVASSMLEFIILSEPNTNTNHDFVVFRGGCPCGTGAFGQGGFEVACENKTPDPTQPLDPTGLGDPNYWGFPNSTQFQPGLFMEAGETYYLFINNVSNSQGFKLEFGPDVQIGQLPKPGPAVSGPTMLCTGNTASYMTAGNPLFEHTWKVNGVIVQGLNIGATLTWTFQNEGTYEICSTIEWPCVIEFDPYCVTVEVVSELPPTILSDTMCFPPGTYPAPDGSTIFAPGVYEYTFESFLGCDSTVELTLAARYGDLEVRSAIVCEGDCIEFEGETICESNVYETTYTNQYGCDSTIQFNLVVVPLETLIDIEDTLSCKKTSVILDGSLSLGGADMIYIWTNAAGDTIDMDSVTVVTEAGSYTLTTTSFIDGDICVDFNTVEVIADDSPPEEVTAIGDTLSCKVSSVTLLGNSTTPGVTYQWSGPNGYASSEQNPTVDEVGTYTLTVTGENGCVEFASAEVVEVVEILEATATGATLNCINTEVAISGGSTEPNVTFEWVGPGGTTYSGQSPTVNEPGSYTLTITDLDGCTGTAIAMVDENVATPQTNAAANEMINCNSTSVLVSGAGSSFGNDFTYEWSTADGNIVSGATTLTPSVNAVGTYTLTVTNNSNGCTSSASTEVAASPEVTVVIADQENVQCFGDDNGSATAAGGGGDGSYSYEWSNGSTTAEATGLSEGNYVVTISDGDDCTATATVTITQPSALAANASATPESAAGMNDGTATANPSGGTPDYTYSWSNGETTASISGLAPGNYTVIITDTNGCETSQTVTVSEVDCFIKANIDKEDVSCNSSDDGLATITLDNALEPYSFVWSNDSTTQTINNLAPGTYTVTATDANGCEVAASVTIVEPPNLNVNATSSDESLPNANDGTASASPTGGTSPYTYEWSNGGTDASITGLPPGEYTVVVTDDHGCTKSQTVVVEGFDCGISVNIESESVNCFGGNDGQATALPAGGIPPFNYLWSNGETTATIGNLTAGTYEVMVTDSTNCPASGVIEIGEPTIMTVAIQEVVPADCGSENGSASVSADGGMPGYSYLWSDGQMDSLATGLAPGVYTVVATDENGCTMEAAIEIISDNTSDIEPPVAVAQDLVIQLDASGAASVAAEDVNNGSSDNCGITAIEIDQTNFTCDNIGENTVTLTVTDVGGNTTSTTAIVTVEDNIPPTISCPADMVVAYCDPVAVFEVEGSDNCQGDLTISQTAGLPSGAEFPEGETTTQTFEATDAYGNIAECSFTVNVSEVMVVNAVSEDVSCFGEDDGTATAQVSGGIAGYTYHWSNDSTSVSIEDLGPGIYTVTATDAAGCEEVGEVEITEPTQLSTTLVNIVNESGGMNNGAVDVTVSGGTMPYTFQWTDLSGNVLGNTEDISGLPAGTYQLFVTDENGCVSSSAYTIQNTNSTFDPTLISRIRLFPNPSKDWVTIELLNVPVDEMDIRIFDVLGRQAFHHPKAAVKSGKYLMDLSSFPEGVYLVELTIEGQTITKRLVRGG